MTFTFLSVLNFTLSSLILVPVAGHLQGFSSYPISIPWGFHQALVWTQLSSFLWIFSVSPSSPFPFLCVSPNALNTFYPELPVATSDKEAGRWVTLSFLSSTMVSQFPPSSLEQPACWIPSFQLNSSQWILQLLLKTQGPRIPFIPVSPEYSLPYCNLLPTILPSTGWCLLLVWTGSS